MESGPGYRWYGREYKAKVRLHMNRNLDSAAIFLVNDIQNSFGDSGVTGQRSGATQSQRAANRSKPWGPPNVASGHLRRNIGWARHGIGGSRRKVGTGIGNKESVGYAMWLEFGTGPRVIEVRSARVLANKDTGQVFGTRVNHPGVLPRPFLRPSLQRNREKLFRMMTRPMAT